MSPPLISRSPDLQRLRDAGYEIGIKAGYLVVAHLPYVNARKEVKLGTLVSNLSLNGDVTVRPEDHQAHFIGEPPCHTNGSPITQIISAVQDRALAPGITINVSFSSKPRVGYYVDYHEKMTTYANIIAGPAEALDPTFTATTGRAPLSDGDEASVFQYVDTASTRAGIAAVSAKLEGQRLALIGLGGTGSYVLDLVAKTPAEIHLFDGDVLQQHNAFRAPGAPSIEDLGRQRKKVEYLAEIYSRMHRRITPHPYAITSANVDELAGFTFAFVCIDKAAAKPPIVEFLEQHSVPFIDAGMGVELVDSMLLGILRVTLNTPAKRDHFRTRVGFVGQGDGDYAKNIQIADLNAFNAALSVLAWKKQCGFYQDLEREHSMTYTINTNMLFGEDAA